MSVDTTVRARRVASILGPFPSIPGPFRGARDDSCQRVDGARTVDPNLAPEPRPQLGARALVLVLTVDVVLAGPVLVPRPEARAHATRVTPAGPSR